MPLRPNGKDYAASDYESDENIGEQYGLNYTINKILQILSRVKHRFDSSIDARYPSIIITTEPIKKALLNIKNNGIQIRFITEITRDNLSYCKELMQIVSEVRHLDGVKGSFAVTDTEYVSYTISEEKGTTPSLKEMVRSTSKEFVEQQQSFFETLWNKAIPAEKKIRDIEEGIPTEVTETWYGVDNILKKSWEVISAAQVTADACHDSKSPLTLASNKQYLQMMLQLKAKGVRQRFITEITNENIKYCRELAKYVQLRHLDSVKGNFTIIDARHYGAIANLSEFQPPSEFINSTVREFVAQQQFFFETLWNKAMPAEERIREIEEGIAPQKLEIIQDTQKSIGRAFDIMSKTQKELLVLFATPRTFNFALRGEAADIYRKISENGVDIKLLVPRGTGNEIEENNKQIAKVQQISSSIDLRFSELDLHTRITIMISDRNEFMSWELKDDTLDDAYQAGGIATYSNIKSLASSYAVIFDNLWKITELAENLSLANIKLESNEKAMKEFINMAAHELRTPIQPILGLSEVVRDRILDLAKQLQSSGKEEVFYKQLKDAASAATIRPRSDSNYRSSSSSLSPSLEEIVGMINVLNRNAKRLERLTSNLLEVSRIENNKSLELSKENFDLVQKIRNVIHDIRSSQDKKADTLEIVYDAPDEPIMIEADKTRIYEVMSNLLRNAIKFTDSGTITITSTAKGRNAMISIKDTGRSIDPELMPRLFTKFASKSETGTGLGLYLSKKIIEAHGGKIWAENNKDGKGATFAFTLPLFGKSQIRQNSKI
jgi:two-component system, OmpR family, sensor histidine kinase VicK